MKPELKHLSPILWTKDLDKTIEYYTTVLGFEARSHFPDFVSLSRDRVEIMFVVPHNDHEGEKPEEPFFPKPILTGSIYITLQHVDELWLGVKDNVEVISPLCDQEYKMRDFSIRDNNGYELVFGENIP
jgi:catechol 2,3-dioxygenase-like lactoylglutathione lyase family enzyme